MAERLACAYVPAIVAELRTLGEAYVELARRLAHSDTAELAGVGEVETGEALAGELGYLLGVLSAAAGSGVLRARRLEAAPRLFAELVAAHHACALEPGPGELPLAAAGGGGGWEGTFALAALLDDAAGRAPGGRLRWHIERRPDGWLLSFPDLEGRAAEREPSLLDALAELGVRAHGAAPAGALLPAAWLVAPGSAARALPG